MEIDLYNLFQGSSALVVFVVIALGYFIGKKNVYGFEVGPSGGVLLVALVFGHYGFEGNPVLGTIGFTIFIYSVGVQAGPRFFSVMREDGRKYILLAVVVAVTSLLSLRILSLLFGFDNGLSAGILAGALTSTPTLVGAQNAIEAGMANMPPGATKQQAIESINVGYAITYIFGTVGLILIAKLAPTILRTDFVKAARLYAKERGYKESDKESLAGLPVVRGYEVAEGAEFLGKTIRELGASRRTKVGLVRALRQDGKSILGPDDELRVGDKVALFASPEHHAEIRERPGLITGVLDTKLLESHITSAEVVVTTDYAVGRNVGELHAPLDYGCFVAKVMRALIELPATDDTVLLKGDVITLIGDSKQLEQLAEKIGIIEIDVQETDLVTFGVGISLGLLLGTVQLKLGTIALGIGSAGGLLLVGIVIGYVRSLSPTFGRMPPAARFIIMEFGLMLFMVNVGLSAGGGVVEAFLAVGPVVILSGIVVLVVPIIAGYLFGHYVLKLNPVVLLGSITGAMTSTPALSAVQEAAKSSMPALGYAGTYAFANVLLTVAGTIIMAL